MFWLWPLKERAIPYNLLFFTVPHRVGTQKICNKMIEIVIVTPSWISEIQSILQMAQGNVGDYLKSICFEIFPMLYSLSQLLQTWFLETFQILVSSSAIHQKYLFLLEKLGLIFLSNSNSFCRNWQADPKIHMEMQATENS